MLKRLLRLGSVDGESVFTANSGAAGRMAKARSKTVLRAEDNT
jgi:hypothetical protein